MSRIDRLHAEAYMLRAENHSELLSVQYLAKCPQPTIECKTTSQPEDLL